MRILFDQGVPRGLKAALREHMVTEARSLGWERISNGALLKLAEEAVSICYLQRTRTFEPTEPHWPKDIAGGSRKITLVARPTAPRANRYRRERC